jgi:hypothetical protein
LKSRAGYWLGGLLIVAAVVGSIAFVALRLGALQDKIESFPRASLNEGMVTLAPGDYTIYLDVPSGSGDFQWTLDIEGLTIRRPSGDFTYDLGGRSGSAIGKVTVTEAREYRVNGTAVPDARVIFGRGLLTGLLSTIFGAIAMFLVAGGAGLALVIVTAVRRRRGRGEEKRWP